MAGAYPVRFLSVLTEAFDNIIEARYPGLVEARLVPCACQDDAGGTCAHAFTLEELLAEATADEPDADHKVRCPKSRRKIEAALMLDGLRGTGADRATRRHPAAHSMPRAAPSAPSTPASRPSSTASAPCSRTAPTPACTARHCSASGRPRAACCDRAQVTVTLWCEWPSGPHPLEGDDGSYTITKMPEALIRYLPYLRDLITALGLAAPALGSAGVALSDQVKGPDRGRGPDPGIHREARQHRRPPSPDTARRPASGAHDPRRDRRGLPRPARHASRPRPG